MPTNIRIEINATVVAKEINPDDPTTTIDQTTHAEPMVFEGQRLKDFTQHVLMSNTNIEDKSYPFTGQDVMTIIMARHIGQMYSRIQDEVMAEVRNMPGDDLREQMDAYVASKIVYVSPAEEPSNDPGEEPEPEQEAEPENTA